MLQGRFGYFVWFKGQLENSSPQSKKLEEYTFLRVEG